MLTLPKDWKEKVKEKNNFMISAKFLYSVIFHLGVKSSAYYRVGE